MSNENAFNHTYTHNLSISGLQVPDNWPSKGEITFDNVSLSYDTDGDPVISQLTLKIPAGQKVIDYNTIMR